MTVTLEMSRSTCRVCSCQQALHSLCATLTTTSEPGIQSRIRIKLPRTSRVTPTLKDVKRRPEKRVGRRLEKLARVTLFAHFKSVLGGVSGFGVVKGSSSNRGLSHIATTKL